MKQTYLYLKMDKHAVFYKYMKNRNIKNYYIFGNKNIIFRALRKFNMLNNSMLFGFWRFKIRNYKYIILGENGYSKKISEYIKKKNPDCKIIMYYWNVINEEYKKILDDNNIDEFWTFDKQDAEKYGLKYNPQFYTSCIKLNEKDIKQDVVFLGRAKNRKNDLLKLQKQLETRGISTKFAIIETEKDIMKYDKYLDLISKSKCIIDYNDEGQTGLTLRPMEALFLKKKLITNNKDIINYDFYNPNNIFVLGKDDIEEIQEFVEKAYEEIDEKIINYYDFEQWLKRFRI